MAKSCEIQVQKHLILGLYVFKSKFFQYPYLPVVNGLQMQIGTSSS